MNYETNCYETNPSVNTPFLDISSRICSFLIADVFFDAEEFPGKKTQPTPSRIRYNYISELGA